MNYNGQDCASQIKTGASSIKMTGTLMPFPGSEVKLPIVLQDNLDAKITTPEVLGISIIAGMVKQLADIALTI